MSGGVPVGNVEEVVELRIGERDFAAVNVELRGLVRLGGGFGRRSGRIDGVGPVGRRVKGLAGNWGLLGVVGGRGGEEYPGDEKNYRERFDLEMVQARTFRLMER